MVKYSRQAFGVISLQSIAVQCLGFLEVIIKSSHLLSHGSPPSSSSLLMRVSFPPCTCTVLLKWGALHYTSARAQRETVYTAVRSPALRSPPARRERRAPFCSASSRISSSLAFHQLNQELIIKQHRRSWLIKNPIVFCFLLQRFNINVFGWFGSNND